MITVLNLKDLADQSHEPALPPVVIDRTSMWGNPFRIGSDGNRTEVVDRFLADARKRFADIELLALDDHALLCHCAPKRCHGNALQLLVANAKGETRKRVLVSGEAPRRGAPFSPELAARYRSVVWQRLDQLPRNGVIIEGGAPGVDSYARHYALEHHIDYVEWPADWDSHRRPDGSNPAGPIRNQEMLDHCQPDEVVCFHQDIHASRGTKDMLKRAQTQGFDWELLPLDSVDTWPKQWQGPVVGRAEAVRLSAGEGDGGQV